MRAVICASVSSISCTPITSRRNEAVSSGVHRKASWPISVTSRLARNRASESGGSLRVSRMMWCWGGRCSSKKASESWIMTFVMTWKSSKINTLETGFSSLALINAVRTDSSEAGIDARRVLRASAVLRGWVRSSAMNTYCQNTSGVLSDGSRDTQAICDSRLVSAGKTGFKGCSIAECDVAQSASNVDLPKPAGADTTVSFRRKPASSNPSSRGRCTSGCETIGTRYLVTRSGCGTIMTPTPIV